MSRGKKLGILLAILAAAVLGAVLAATLTARSSEGENGEVVLAIPADQITGISWSYQGEDLHFVRHGDTWVCPEQEEFPVDTDQLETMLSNLTEIRSYKEITGNSRRSDFGLDPAVLTITVSADREYILCLGNENDQNGQVYAETEGDIFLTDSLLRSQFSKGILDMVQQETVPAMDTVLSAEIRRGGETVTLEEDESGERSYYSGYRWIGSDGEADYPLDTEAVETFLGSLTTLRWTGTAAYPADSSQLDGYGLADPAAAVTVRYRDEDGNDRTFQLYVGAETGSGECYAMIPGSDRIYVTGDTLRSTLTQTALRDLMPKEVLAVDWNSVKTMTLSMDGREISLERNEGGDTIEDAEKQIWKESGSQRTADLTEAIRSLTELQGDPVTGSGPGGLRFTLVMERNTANYPQLILTIREGDDGTAIVSLNDTQHWSVEGATAEEVIRRFQTALSSD